MDNNTIINTEDNISRLNGIGGWLILVIIGLSATIIKGIYSLLNFYYPLYSKGTLQALSAPSNKYYSPLWGPVITFEAVSGCIFILLAMSALLLIFLKKKFLPKFMITLYLLNFIFSIIIYILTLQLPTIDGSTLVNSKGLINGVVTCSIWIPYFLRSERVKNTFIK